MYANSRRWLLSTSRQWGIDGPAPWWSEEGAGPSWSKHIGIGRIRHTIRALASWMWQGGEAGIISPFPRIPLHQDCA